MSALLEETDTKIKTCLESILNIPLEQQQWTQASLPIRHGGLGIRKISDLSLPAFLASAHGVVSHVSNILQSTVDICDIAHVSEALQVWRTQYANIIPPIGNVQKNWDSITIKHTIETKLNFNSDLDNARFKALQNKESGAWLQAIPSKNIGTLLEDNIIRYCFSLRLGISICKTFTCICGAKVDKYGIHPLSCPKSSGRVSRHATINDILKRALNTIGFPANLEPTGLSRDDGKRPDGATLIPWSKGQCMIWDATCVDTLAPSHIQSTSGNAGAAAENACRNKHNKYSKLKTTHIFYAFAVETMGVWCEEAKSLCESIGKLLISKTGDTRSSHYLTQRISLAIQRGNAASFYGSFSNSQEFEEAFYLS